MRNTSIESEDRVQLLTALSELRKNLELAPKHPKNHAEYLSEQDIDAAIDAYFKIKEISDPLLGTPSHLLLLGIIVTIEGLSTALGKLEGVDEPDVSDGCDKDGFAGGCERAGHTPESHNSAAADDGVSYPQN